MADTMAASSGGVEWSLLLKPFLSPRYETSSRSEIIELCSTIIKCEAEILRRKENNKKFYDNFVVLSADYISTCASKLPVSQIDTISAACRVLLKYLIGCLQQTHGSDAAQIEIYLNAVRVLCLGTHSLSYAQVSVLVDRMKGENLPQHTNPTPPGGEKDAPSPKETPKTRTDLSMDIFEQLTLPLRDGHTTTLEPSSSSANQADVASTSNDPASEINKLFLKTNTESLQALRAGDTLVDLCLNLQSIKKSRSKVEDALAGKPFGIPTNQSEAQALKNCMPSNLSEIKLALSAINLPVLEPLTPSKLDKLLTLSMSVLQIAISQAAANAVLATYTSSTVSPKQPLWNEDDVENETAMNLVEEALNLYSYVGQTIKNSTRAGGHVYQNHLLAGAWVLVSGLQAHFTSISQSTEKPSQHQREEKGRSPSKSNKDSVSARTGLQKFQQSFGILLAAIATKTLTLLTELFEDLHLEACCGGAGSIGQIEPAPLAIMGQFTALQRVARVLGAAPLSHFLFYLALVSYGKACSLKGLFPREDDTSYKSQSTSYSTSYYSDTVLMSEHASAEVFDSTDSEDSEPILGQWLKETLAPPETQKQPSTHKYREKTHVLKRSLTTEKGELHTYITLATNIFIFFNKHMLCTKSAYVSRYVKTGLTGNEQHMIILAAIIRDLDRECSKNETSISTCEGLAQMYSDFSGALSRFTHNLVTNNNLTSLQACLLNHLGVSPWNTDQPHGWPLQVYPRTLSVLSQVLLLRPQNEKEASVISIWHRLVNTLIENVLITTHSTSESYNEDLNVEHAQVLLYLFHSLNLMQKKSVLLLLAGGILRCSEIARGTLRDSQLLHLSRLLLLFDYIMKHLYDAPSSLLEQIQWNLFHSTNLNADKDKEIITPTRKYTCWQEIEENYNKCRDVLEHAMRPRFYVLTTLEINNQDAPKLDGLACNFILGTPDKLRYPLLLDALIEILNVTHVTATKNITFLGLCATQYCFTICWRLLQLLPPSVPYMERLVSAEAVGPGPLMLHSLIWGPRTAHKNFHRWLKDCLVKQGLYTQHTDKLLKAVSDGVNNLKYDVSNAKNCIIALTPDIKKDVVLKENLPPLWHLCLLDCLLGKVQVGFDEAESTETPEGYVQDLFPHVLKLTQSILHCIRWSLLHMTLEQNGNTEKSTQLQDVLAMASNKNTLISTFASEILGLLPGTVQSVQQQWNSSPVEEFTSTPYQNEIIPSESYILKIVDTHISTLSMNNPFTVNLSLRRFLKSAVKFICDHASKIENTDTKNKAIEMLVCITLDLRTDYLHDSVSKTLDKMIGDTETDEHQKRVYLQVLEHTYNLIIHYNADDTMMNEQILHCCLKFYEKILEKSAGRQALETFFSGDRDLVKVLMSVSSPQMSQQYSTKVLQFFNKLFQAAEKSSTDPSLNYLCSSMSKLADVELDRLQTWLKQIIIGTDESDNSITAKADTSTPKTKLKEIQEPQREEQKSIIQENSQLLQALTSFIVKQDSNVSEDVSLTLLKALIPLGSTILSPNLNGTGFTDLMVVMTMLADAGNGKGHTHLFPVASDWLELCNKLDETIKYEAGCCILDYISDVVNVIANQNLRPLSPPWEGETPLDLDCNEWQDDVNEDEDSGEDSDEDSLSNKLCTFTVTQKEFMNQHWYHCHTCKMLDGVGVCSVCARVCHKGHDLSYAKYGNFFCDCGAKEDGSCQALVKRSITSEQQQQPNVGTTESTSEMLLHSSLRRRASSPVVDKIKYREKKHVNIKQLQGSKDWIIGYLSTSNVTKNLINFMSGLIGSVAKTCIENSPVGCYSRAKYALIQLHTDEKKFVYTDQLMTGTVGSQEGAFENVRMSYAGEQGQTIRQLLSAHIIRRVAMCCMTSTHGRRQHLAVSHEKGKITVLQLSALLKQNDSTTRKLTLSKLGSAPIPFTVLSMSSNLCNEDYLAVCGLKDCHVLTFTASGGVSDHLVLHPQLDSGNFIIKAIWLPGSQTKLALVTADFVKIYDLSVDALSPQYFFLVPSGKIRDCTFIYSDGLYYMLVMSSPGHVYSEVLSDDSSAKHGTFYVTNTLEGFHSDLPESNGQVAGGGVSIYYSHTLGLLFFSFVQGKSFISPIDPETSRLTNMIQITLPPTNSSSSKSNGGRNIATQPLCQWTEIPNHPGLVCCATQSSNNPVILMIKPDVILVQEVKTVPPKTKIMDMVAIRHTSGNELRTTLMLLCEDGSLKMSVANMEQTGFWMSPKIQPTISNTNIKPKKKKVIKSGGKTSSAVQFPVDFFEHCQVMNDVEVGGNDLLQIYNVAQLKHRLNATGLYVACNKPLGFTVEITNPDSNMVMVGARVLVGTQDVQKAPSFVEVFGRLISFTTTRSRWYDIPFSREESLQADKKLTIMFGPSQDPETLTMVDSIKIYGKTKDAFGWPEESEETATNNANPSQQLNAVASEKETQNSNFVPLTKLEKLVISILEALDGVVSLYPIEDKYKQPALQLSTQLLTFPTPPLIQMHSKALMCSLHTARQQYHNFKDQALLEHVMESLNILTMRQEIDAESYYRLVLIVRGIAVSRPQNLVKFSDSYTCIQDVVLEDPLDPKPASSNSMPYGQQQQHLLLKLMEVLWMLHSQNPENPNLAPVAVPGLKHTEQVIHALVEIVHAFNSCDTYSNITMAVYLQLLLCKDPAIAFSAKQALSKVLKPKMKRRRVFIPSPPHCATPPHCRTPPPPPQNNQNQAPRLEHVDNVLEALLGADGVYEPLLEIPPDADDAMVELAIALSLQEHDGGAEQPGGGVQEAGHFSDTTASAAGSDDEGSTAATDGSTLRTSPAEQGGSAAGSESGGSGVESITGEHNVSGRSSAYGDNAPEAIASKSDTSAVVELNPTQSQETDLEADSENSGRLHVLRLQLLERLTEYLPKLRNVDGMRTVPFFQVVLQLTSDLDSHSERDLACFNALLGALIVELQLNQPPIDICTRTKQKEVQLVIMKLLSVFMGRSKSSSTTAGTSKSSLDNSTFVSRVTATVLHKSNVINHCKSLLEALLKYWTSLPPEESKNTNAGLGGNLLREHPARSPPDMMPFFVKQFVKENGPDIFKNYPEILTETSLRLPYQIHKYSEITETVNIAFDDQWYDLLCEYMMTSQVPSVRRQVRKLLLFICGNKEKYRYHRDIHALNKHLNGVLECCVRGGYESVQEVEHSLSLSYDLLVELVEHLKACVEIAIGRTGNWQRFCLKQDTIIAFLVKMSCVLDEGVAPTILHLLQCAIASSPGGSGTKKSESKQSRKDREKSDDSAAEALFEETNCLALVAQINKQVNKDVLEKFVKTFMLETNTTSVRWQVHTLILSIYKNSKPEEQEVLLKLLWRLWPLVPNYGRKASQFVDLLGYFSLKFFQSEFVVPQVTEYVEKAVSILTTQNELLAHHPNANLYAHMSQFVEMDGYYLESELCLVCNNPEIPFSTIKLSSLKVDSKFTTTTQIVKLLSSHTISKITIRIGDLKRTKMVRTVNIYYNNRNVQAVVELKNKPALWHKAKKVTVQSGQMEVKIEFPLPIVACNLMIEYSDFYENIQASSETLQCPRCSAAVPANPGICANCGENVFQCHKCRAINYDEKDPFLCHACGFCKYAKFDFTLLAKPCCAIEPIENDDDRKKTVANINSLLEKADRVYKQLIANKPTLEGLVVKVTEQRNDKKDDAQSSVTTASVVGGQQSNKVNKTIQVLAQQYCNECKTSFEELSKIIQKVLVSRKELVAYDRKHRDVDVPKVNVEYQSQSQQTRCYGCSTAATEHCLTLLRALASNPTTREILCSKGLIQELVWNNLRKGSTQIQEEVKQLLCVLTRDNPQATEELCNLLMDRITLSLNGHVNSCDIGTSVRHEISLLAAMVQKEDQCWELKLRCMMKLFLKACEDSKSPLVMESIILPCLKILQSLMKPPESKSVPKEKSTKDLNGGTTVDVYKFLNKDKGHTFSDWKDRCESKEEGSLSELPKNRKEVRAYYLSEKYAKKWKKNLKRRKGFNDLALDGSSWLKSVLFNHSSRLARLMACSILELMCGSSNERKKEILILLTCFLEELATAGESSAEFLTLYQSLIREVPWKQFLTIQGVLLVLADLITMEIEQLHYLEATTLTSGLAQGYALNQLTELLASFLDDVAIRRQYKGRLVGAVLNGYLSLRRLVVQRTRLIDDTQEKLLELLEEMTTGTEEETKSFMTVCIETVEKHSVQDILTPVFIFERLCSIIYPEENDVHEFFLTLEKDPQQEDFLQGRMLGNPYPSSEPGLGPLMRDVKNKICQDCELVALLEDDNGMELLVNNKIISLDLPVKEVYKKIWVAEGGDHDAMRVVYRMRGLLGDATEEFIETLTNKSQSTVDNEEVYKMANVLADCGGLQVMVKRLGAVQNAWRAKPLLQVLLKLFRLCIKVNRCQEVLIQPELGAMEVFLRTLRLCLDGEPDPCQAAVTEQLLDIMETVLSKATSESLDNFKTFSRTFGGPEYVESLLTCTTHPSVRNNQAVLVHLTRVLAALVYGNKDKMKILMDYFKPVLDLNRYDYEHTSEDQQKLEMLCVLTDGIERNAIGSTLKDYIINMGVVKDYLEYITMHAPCVKPTLLRTDSDELKDFISKPALKYCLRFLTGLAHSHENTQLAVAAAETIPIIHRLEQVSSDEHVGSLAENLLEALCTNSIVAKQIEEVREFTRAEKKRLAMAMREKQLGQLGMRTNDKGQVTAKSAILQQMEELGEESGLVCCICREGYKYQPAKVLGIYTFTKRCNVEEFEAKARKTAGYTTVSHFNIVHIDCHMSAVRLARARDEWESAALQNANTKCNGLLPLWGPQVPESAFASCLARHNTYLQESTNHRDIGHSSTIHDLKLLLWRFAQEKTFHEDTGGGGPQSNMHMIPYIVHIALYVINTTRVSKREESSLMSYLKCTNVEKWIESAYEAEGPLYWATMSILLHSPQQWNVHRLSHLKRFVILAQTRHCYPSGPQKVLQDKTLKEYDVYKAYLVFFALIDGMYKYCFKNVQGSEEQWSTNLADYIRHNDEALMKASEKLLAAYTDELLPCTSFVEFCDVTGLLDVISSPDTYISDLLKDLS